jgi:hypothetical protein
MKTFTSIILLVAILFSLSACESLLPGFTVDESKVKPLESGSCVNGVIELKPLAGDGDSIVRVIVNGNTDFYATVKNTDSQGIVHRKIAGFFPSGTISVSARGADNQPIGPILQITCP